MPDKNLDLDKLKEVMIHPKLGEILLQRKKITINQLVSALDQQLNCDLPLGQILMDKGFIQQNELVELLSLQKNIDKLLQDSYCELEQLNGDNT